MAATDKPYRDQNTLDVVFAISSILMLVSIVWMFMQDYNREYKTEQRSFRDVEAALAQRMALDQLPPLEEFDKAEEKVRATRETAGLFEAELKGQVARLKKESASAADETVNKQLKDLEDRIERQRAIRKEMEELRQKLAQRLPDKERGEQRFQTIQADLGSEVSLYNIDVDHHGPQSEHAKQKYAKILGLEKSQADQRAKVDAIMVEIKEIQSKLDAREKPLTDAITALKKVNDKFDAQVRLAISKQWGVGDLVRTLPVIDGFASPLKIHQFTINDIPIDYNFKYVTRFDRCVSCHQGIDKPAFTKDKLRELTRIGEGYEDKISQAHVIMYRRRQDLKGLPERAQLPRWQELQLSTVAKTELTEARVTEYCAHPRLDLFVGSNSKHPAEKFGCTSCHSGQGSSTSFTLASHTPNDAAAKQRWTKEHGWEALHMWDFPMLPQRFVESSCIKCHHQVTDLISSDNRNEAPKLVRGYNLIKENGCFGCHEINGRKGGRPVGPDLRLEPTPPLDYLTPLEQTRAESDPDNPPGNLRKVGPSLYRLSEKTYPAWTAKWLRSPRSFRADTKMPHFYGLSNNLPDVLPEDQKKFPDTEIWAATHYLFEASKKAPQRLDELKAKNAKQLTEDEQKELAYLSRLYEQRQIPEAAEGNAARGRVLFSERGCLACHSHSATEISQGEVGKPNFAPSINGEALFGPNLSQVAEKLTDPKKGKAAARNWLVQWLINPQVHSPRSRMPVTHLTREQAADVAEWLLAQKAAATVGPDWDTLSVREPGHKDLQALAEVYLIRIFSKSDMDILLKAERSKEDVGRVQEVARDIPLDEKVLIPAASSENLKLYLGKKAVGRLGCYACHDIPGFQNAKPVGVALNDWGKKDPSRLAFEDIASFLRDHYHVTPSLVNENGKAVGPKEGKLPYEKFYADALLHHPPQREGYLNQKILDPRSYDYNRLRTWDDRSRMPQFRFARSHKRSEETAAEFEARAWKDEAKAREAVATFILGLVAEPVPMASVNQPKGDRLAEIKGRQVLDKYNCAGCHLVRPGYLEFKSTPEATQELDNLFTIFKGNAKTGGEHTFLDHANWVGRKPTSADRLSALGVKAQLYLDPEKEVYQAEFRLTRALSFQAADRTLKNIEAANVIRLDPKLMVAPPREAWESKTALAAYLKDQGPYGGAFADVLVDYLMRKDKKKYEPNQSGDNDTARASVPPILLGQGERTQTEWLYQFLLKPHKVRRMTVLEMPRFNLGKDEARALVDYFAAVEKNENPGIGLTSPYETIPQQEDLQEVYWLKKNAEYVAVLKDAGLYKERVEELKPIWAQVHKELEARLAEAKTMYDKATAQADAAKKAADMEKDKEAKKPLEKAQTAAEDVKKAWETEVEGLGKLLNPTDKDGKKRSWEDQQTEDWEKREAYLTDAFRLLNDRDMCSKCHQVGKQPIKNDTEGPPLTLAHKRLRPGWTGRWIATPQKFLTYRSLMPVNFPATEPAKDAKKAEEMFVGGPLDKIMAVRDLLMNYPRAQALPVNQYRLLPPPKDAGDKKK